MKTLVIIQARMSSSRLPGKVLLPVGGKPMILYQLERVNRCIKADHITVATSSNPEDDVIESVVKANGFSVFRGSLDDVLERFYRCSIFENADTVVRLTGDCPLIDPVLVDELIDEFYRGDWDYLSNAAIENQLSVPDGFDVEVFKASLLSRAASEAHLPSEREHVTPWFRSEIAGLRWGHFRHEPIRSFYRVTVDDPADLEVVRAVVNSLDQKYPNFGVDEVVKYLQKHPEIAALNLATVRNEGYLKSLMEDQLQGKSVSISQDKGQDLWRRAKRVLPGGNMLLSKRSEMFLPDQWPAYFSRAKGCRVWDLNERELIDMSIMGIGTNVLGYGDPEVILHGKGYFCWQYEHTKLSGGGLTCRKISCSSSLVRYGALRTLEERLMLLRSVLRVQQPPATQ